MSLLRKCLFTVAAIVAIHAGSTARAVSITYFGSTTPNFTSPPSWSVGDPLSTSQLWDVFTGNTGGASLSDPGNFLSNGGLATPTLNVSGGISKAIYNFTQGPVTATIPNYGGPTGSRQRRRVGSYAFRPGVLFFCADGCARQPHPLRYASNFSMTLPVEIV